MFHLFTGSAGLRSSLSFDRVHLFSSTVRFIGLLLEQLVKAELIFVVLPLAPSHHGNKKLNFQPLNYT